MKQGITPIAKLIVLACGMLLPTACSYQVGSGDRQIPGGYDSISVPVFKNLTQETGVEVYFTNAMIRELERSRIGRVADKSSSQVTLEGAITGIRYAPVNQVLGEKGKSGLAQTLPTGTLLNTQYRIFVDVRMKLVRNSDQSTLWEGAFSRERTYQTPQIGAVGPIVSTDTNDTLRSDSLTGANALYNHSARYQNIEVMAFDLMSEAHDRLTEKF